MYGPALPWSCDVPAGFATTSLELSLDADVGDSDEADDDALAVEFVGAGGNVVFAVILDPAAHALNISSEQLVRDCFQRLADLLILCIPSQCRSLAVRNLKRIV